MYHFLLTIFFRVPIVFWMRSMNYREEINTRVYPFFRKTTQQFFGIPVSILDMQSVLYIYCDKINKHVHIFFLL